MKRLVLELPLPPAPNVVKRWGFLSGYHRTRKENAYKREVWAAALEQAMPSSSPPARVEVSGLLRVRNLRDEADNLPFSLKLVLDALRQPPAGEVFTWRQGIAEAKGYFMDDSPRHLVPGGLDQVIDRRRPGLELVIAELGAHDAAGLEMRR